MEDIVLSQEDKQKRTDQLVRFRVYSSFQGRGQKLQHRKFDKAMAKRDASVSVAVSERGWSQ